MQFTPDEVMAALPRLTREASLELENLMLRRRLELVLDGADWQHEAEEAER